MELTDDEVRRFADACADPDNAAAKGLMLSVGASSASGVLARIVVASDEDRERLIALIRRAITR